MFFIVVILYMYNSIKIHSFIRLTEGNRALVNASVSICFGLLVSETKVVNIKYSATVSGGAVGSRE